MTTFLAPFCFHVAKIATICQINPQCYSKCPKCLPSAFTQAHRRFLKLADCVLHSKSSQVLTSVSGCPLAADSGDRSSAASTPKHDSQADLCPGYLAARSLCQWSLDSELHASHCWVTFAACHMCRRSILSVQCMDRFTCVCVCPSHFLSTRLQVRPL